MRVNMEISWLVECTKLDGTTLTNTIRLIRHEDVFNVEQQSIGL